MPPRAAAIAMMVVLLRGPWSPELGALTLVPGVDEPNFVGSLEPVLVEVRDGRDTDVSVETPLVVAVGAGVEGDPVDELRHDGPEAGSSMKHVTNILLLLHAPERSMRAQSVMLDSWPLHKGTKLLANAPTP